jgi:hypothetical protein
MTTKVKIRMVSIKLLLKTMYGIYYEKAIASKDSKAVENQTLIEYLYDSFFHKYGISTLTEKKVKEILITLKSQRGVLKLKTIAKFLWLYESDNYSTDDLKFFFNINKTFVQFNAFDNLVASRKEYNFESDKCDAALVVHVIQDFFEEKLNDEALKAAIQKFKTDVSTYNSIDIAQFENEELTIFVDINMVEEWFIDLYIENKRSIASDLIDNDFIPEVVIEAYDGLGDAQIDKLTYVMNSTIEQNDCKRILSEYSQKIDEESLNVFCENNKANPLEMLMEESEHINIETDIR